MTKTATRKLDLRKLKLDKGAHSPDGKFCIMEATAYIAGEDWTDKPKCVSPVIGAFLRSWNDTLDDETRQKLKPYIRRVIDTRTTEGHVLATQARALIAERRRERAVSMDDAVARDAGIEALKHDIPDSPRGMGPASEHRD